MFLSCQELAALYLILRHQQFECDCDPSAKLLVKSDLSSECRALWYNSGTHIDLCTDMGLGTAIASLVLRRAKGQSEPNLYYYDRSKISDDGQ